MILLVDDEPTGLRIRKKLLEAYGYKVLTSASGRDALSLFAENQVDAVVLDYSMPEMDGGQIAAEMKRLNPQVKILLLSAYVDLPEAAVQCVDRRAVKGASTVAFLNEVQQLVAC